jgi:3D (Asp-Asp-Asp) domain-containing protein
LTAFPTHGKVDRVGSAARFVLRQPLSPAWVLPANCGGDAMNGMSRACAILALGLLPIACTTEQSLTVKATAYNSTRAQTDGRPHEAAWGHTVKPGMKVIAVSRDLIKKGLEPGTKVRIEGLRGSYTVIDKMAARYRNRIDIYMGRDVQAAREWGVQEVTIRWAE